MDKDNDDIDLADFDVYVMIPEELNDIIIKVNDNSLFMAYFSYNTYKIFKMFEINRRMAIANKNKNEFKVLY